MDEQKEPTIILHEQDSLGEELSLKLRKSGFSPTSKGFMEKPELLGIGYGGSNELRASYYVGACHLPGNLGQLIVLPKILNLDFLTMLTVCSSYMPSADYFSKCYGINIDEPPIENAMCYDLISPLLALHFTFVLDKLVKLGLSKDYAIKHENLNGKIKGRIDISLNLKHNIVNSRGERFFCRFQEYTNDIPINQLLKKAFTIAKNSLHKVFQLPAEFSARFRLTVKLIEESMRNVSDVSNIQSNIPKRKNKLNPYYTDALKLANELICQHEANIRQGENLHKTVRPFWIDFSRLFEVYVLALMQEEYGSQIQFQVKGYKAVADYIHQFEHIIMDAKYKTIYQTDDYNINDIREISGNARDNKICSKFVNWFGKEPECIIIYPDYKGIKRFSGPISLIKNKKGIDQFRNFYKIGVSLPLIP